MNSIKEQLNHTLNEFSVNLSDDSYSGKVRENYYINDKNTFSVFTNQNLFDGGAFGQTGLFFENNPSLNQNQVIDNTNENLSQQYNINYICSLYVSAFK